MLESTHLVALKMNGIKKMTIKGYHGTSEKYKSSIEECGFDPLKSKPRKDHWLGQGVYFFTQFSIARGWANIVAKKKNENALVYSASIEADKQRVLDLRTYRGVDCFLSAVIKFLNENADLKYALDDSQYRAVFFDMYKEQYDIYVMIARFPKTKAWYASRRTSEEKSIREKLFDITGIMYLEEQICVSKKECISKPILVYNESMEVV